MYSFYGISRVSTFRPLLVDLGVKNTKLTEYSTPHELQEDSFDTIGAENIEWRVIDSGHEFPLTHADEVVNEICGVWGL
jgi:hypothetical protein